MLEPGPLLGEPDDAAGGPGPGVAGGLGELVAALAQVVLVRVDHLGEGRGHMVEVECTVGMVERGGTMVRPMIEFSPDRLIRESVISTWGG